MKTLYVLLFMMVLVTYTKTISAQDNPVADFTISSNPVCRNESVSFADLSTDPNSHNIVSWSWTFGDGGTSNVMNPTHVYNVYDSLEVTLIVFNDVGGSDTAVQVIVVHGLDINLNPVNAPCFGSCDGYISLSAFGTSMPFQYYWSNGSTAPFISNGCAGTYYVTVINDFGCSAVDSATIYQLPPMTIDFQTSQCLDTSGTGWITAIINNGGPPPYQYQWSPGGWGTTIIATPGIFTFTVVNGNGCIASETIDFHTASLCDYTLKGRVYNDINGNCLFDSSDAPMQGIMVYSNPGQVYGYTNDSGYYYLPLDTGAYSIMPVLPQYWTTQCPSLGFHNVTIVSSDTLTGIDFGLAPSILCPLMHVSLDNAVLRPCMASNYNVHYSNQGTATAYNVFIEVEFDSDVVPYTSSLPWASFTGNTYRFDLGDVGALNGGSFTIGVIVDCDMTILGHTKCATAHIYPDSICTAPSPSWDHSSVSVTGECRGDTLVCFVVTNTGSPSNGNMQGTSEYRIFSNDTLIFTGTFQLDGGESTEICWPANGTAIRLEADQRPGHPGNSQPRETIEDCGDIAGSSLGYITTTPYDDIDPFIDMTCRIVTGSYDPNDKSVQPTGVTDNHYIENDATLNYHINFQNSGTDTAFNIVIRDTLSQYLDVTTVQNGASSHPCTFLVYGTGILEWTFSNILLPDSNTNEPASHGFVNFTVDQKPLTPADYGTVISNSAAIYFDFNPPVITNVVDLVYWNLPLTISVVPDVTIAGAEVVVYPNPVTTQATFELKNYSPGHDIKLRLSDNTGRELCNTSVSNTNKIVVPVDVFKKGLYFYQITDEKGIIGRGKLIVE